jgi:TonB-dependent receptor
LSGERDIEEDLGDFEAKENIFAGYGMVEFQLGSKARLLPGVRVEYTDLDYTGRELVFDEEGDLASVDPTSGKRNYTDALPMVHFLYNLPSDVNLRAAFTRTLSRPNHYDIVPYQLILQEDNEIERGNPNLVPTKSWNFDLLAEKFFENVGIASGGIFYKNMKNNIFTSRFEEEREGDTWEITQPENLKKADLFGVEAAFQNTLLFLPSPLDGIGLYANYTYAWSEADLPGRTGRLPGQAEHVSNFALFYEKYGFSGKIAWNYHNDYLFEVGLDPSEDLFIDRHLQLDLTLSQRLSDNFRVFAEFINLTNEPYRVFQEKKSQPIQVEYYSWWATFGVKMNF